MSVVVMGKIIDKPDCNNPLGVGDGTVKDDMMKASSSFSSATVGAENGRLGWERGGGAWCPATLVAEESSEWIEIDLGKEAKVTGLLTQGRWAGGQGQEFTEWIRLEWWSEDEGVWKKGGGPLAANSDTYSKVELILDTKKPIVTRKVRVIPVSKHPRMVCLRVELLGCWKSPDLPLSGGESKGVEVQVVEIQTERDINSSGGEEFESESVHKYHPVAKPHENNTDRTNHSNRNNKNKPKQKQVDVFLPDNPSIGVSETSSWLDTQYMGVAVGILVTVILILVAIIAFILYKNSKTGLGLPVEAVKGNIEGVEDSEWSMVYGSQGRRQVHMKMVEGGLMYSRPVTRREEVYSDVSTGTSHSSPLLSSQGSPPQPHHNHTTPQPPPFRRDHHYSGGLNGGVPPVNYYSGSLRVGGGPPVNHYNGGSTINHYSVGPPVNHYAATDLIQLKSGSGGRGNNGVFL